MIITLRNEELKTKDQVINQKQKEGYTLINISESFDSVYSGPQGEFSSPKLVLEFKKI